MRLDALNALASLLVGGGLFALLMFSKGGRARLNARGLPQRGQRRAPRSKRDRRPKVKHFRLAAEEIRPIAPGHGGAIACDRITVDGFPVGYMYRTEARDEFDSGWVFLAADGSEAYINNPENLAIYDVNTVANYDPDIIPLLDAPAGSAFIRTRSGLVPDLLGAPSDTE